MRGSWPYPSIAGRKHSFLWRATTCLSPAQRLAHHRFQALSERMPRWKRKRELRGMEVNASQYCHPSRVLDQPVRCRRATSWTDLRLELCGTVLSGAMNFYTNGNATLTAWDKRMQRFSGCCRRSDVVVAIMVIFSAAGTLWGEQAPQQLPNVCEAIACMSLCHVKTAAALEWPLACLAIG